MCFTIDKKAKRWRVKHVFKVVKKYDDVPSVFIPPHMYGRGTIYEKNKITKKGPGSTREGKFTNAGIYVCKTLAAARRYYIANSYLHQHKREDYRIIKLLVKQKDFLYASIKCSQSKDCATYKQVMPTGNVYQVMLAMRERS